MKNSPRGRECEAGRRARYVLVASARLAVAVGAEGGSRGPDAVPCRVGLRGLAGRPSPPWMTFAVVAPMVLAHRTRRGRSSRRHCRAKTRARALRHAGRSGDDAIPSATARATPPARRPPVPAAKPRGRASLAHRLGPASPRIDRRRWHRHGADDPRRSRVLPPPMRPLQCSPRSAIFGRRRVTDPTATVAPRPPAAMRNHARSPRHPHGSISGSMGAPQRAAAASGTVLGLLTGPTNNDISRPRRFPR